MGWCILFSKIKNVLFGRKNNKNEDDNDSLNRKEYEVWGPTIDYTKCKNCTLCYKVCKNGVYAVENGKVVVKNKSNCVKGCSKCIEACRYGAISFPND